MNKGRTWLAIPLIALTFAGGDGGNRYRDQMAVIEIGSDGTLGFEAGVQVTLPDTVAVGRAAYVKIRTYGGGCLIRDQQRGGRTFRERQGPGGVTCPVGSALSRSPFSDGQLELRGCSDILDACSTRHIP